MQMSIIEQEQLTLRGCGSRWHRLVSLRAMSPQELTMVRRQPYFILFALTTFSMVLLGEGVMDKCLV